MFFYWHDVTLYIKNKVFICFCCFRMELTCLSLSADCVWESWSNCCYYHTPLCSRTFEWAFDHPLHTSPGSGGICFSCTLLVPYSLSRRNRKVSDFLPPHLCVIFGLLYIKCHLLTFHVSLPSGVYSDILHWSGLQCLVPLYCGFRARCWEATVYNSECNSTARLLKRKLSCRKFLWIFVYYADSLLFEFLGFITKKNEDTGRCSSRGVCQTSPRKESRGIAPTTYWKCTSFRGADNSGGTATYTNILEEAKHVLVVTARPLQCSYQWSPAICAKFHLFTLWHYDVSPVCGPGEYCKSTGLLFNHVFCNKVKPFIRTWSLTLRRTHCCVFCERNSVCFLGAFLVWASCR